MRIKNGVWVRKRYKKWLKFVKGYFGVKSKIFK